MHHTATRWKTRFCFCCPVQVARTIASLQTWAYSVSENAVWVHLYGGSRLQTNLPDGTPVKLTQETDYPWKGDVKINISTRDSLRCSLGLRLPPGTSDHSLSLNGNSLSLGEPEDDYLKLEREWEDGDSLSFSFDIPVRSLQAHPAVETDRGRVALERGPIVYCLEEVDNFQGLDKLILPREAQFESEYEPELLCGVISLRGQGLFPQEDDWERVLYRPKEEVSWREREIKAVPYYAWDHRESGEMLVWLRSEL